MVEMLVDYLILNLQDHVFFILYHFYHNLQEQIHIHLV